MMKKLTKLLSCMTAFAVLTAFPVLPAQAEASGNAFTAEDVQRTYNTRFYEEFHNIDMERILEADAAGLDSLSNVADTVHFSFAGIAFVWHGEGTPQGVAFGDFAPEWIDKGRVNGGEPRLTTAMGYLTAYARLDDPNWPEPANEQNYSWTEPTEITQYPETIYLAGTEYISQTRSDHCYDCAKTAAALMADERVEVIGLLFGTNTRPADWNRESVGARAVPVPAPGTGFLVCSTFVMGYNYSAVLVPVQHFETVRGDLTGDGKVTLEDVSSALEVYTQSLLGIAPDAAQFEIIDVDGCGEFDLTDVINILQYYNYNEVLGVSVSWEDIICGKA